MRVDFHHKETLLRRHPCHFSISANIPAAAAQKCG